MGADFSRLLALASMAVGLVAACTTPETGSFKAAVSDESCGSVAAEFFQTGESFSVRSNALAAVSSTAPALGPTEWELQLSAGAASVLPSLLAELESENGQIERIKAVYDRVTDCRKTQVKAVRAEVADGRTNRSRGELRLALIHERYENDVRIARLIGEVISLRSARFRYANEKINPGPARQARLGARPAQDVRQRIADQTATNQAKRNDFLASIARAESWQSNGFILG